MIAPLVPYAVRGAIWYQGESNAGKAYEYRTLFPAMIRDWRKQWGRDFPFLLVQLAPFMKITTQPGDSNWAELREAQYRATKVLPKVGMAVITDVGEENDIHPKKKAPVGNRLALLARKIAYGEGIVAMGPEYKSMKVEGNRAVLTFDNVGAGLECRGEKLTGFAVAGADRKFHNAEAEIRGDTVVVHSPAVEKPVAVRFGWANYPVVNLWNKDGLPATPFRTDDWPGITQPKETKAARK
jgi:sialate O-acetylesterase